MVNSNETLSFAIYMANKWNIHECAIIFNGKDNVGDTSWNFSLGEHIWDKYISYYNDYTVYGAPMKLIYELDTNNLNKLIARACELYDGRKNKI